MKDYSITRMLIDAKWRQRPGGNREPRYAVAHDTGNEGSTALQNYTYFNSRNLEASAHVFIDDEQILMIIPLQEKAWHVRSTVSDANDWAIGVELCFGGNIDFEEAYRRYVWYFAYLCSLYHWKPSLHIRGHFQLDPRRRTDPVNALKKNGKSFDLFLKDVQKQYSHLTEGPETAQDEKKLYRVQIGAFQSRVKAEELVRKAKQAGFDAMLQGNEI